LAHFSKWKALFAPYLVDAIISGGGGADIGPLKIMPEVVLIGFRPDTQRYFDIHHSSNDVFENVNKRELELGAGAMTSLIYLIDQYGTK
jgi:carboxypeptidase Q